ncbi:ribulose-phosphate 3-epimerase [Leadbettera azotonutricia]|uniref:Ribulose-phosphate 3-epimerase n=1 Tax=Leadbettera azotonutricia (strain ATCC BAA-888 / DSM 13862 / ZAS-9) TaxID=545695 RepID=F5YCC6_LEAAZ|nr:ribulose-phosphate 3-epimerase [Leadbettera azotonutricia]AEF81851.1 ribulose-phosphate 3-epimerase [Leadbettera azotonutricia ZAS-9]
MGKAQLAPSMMCADIFKLGETIRLFEKLNVPYLHIDVMDGSFVPNLMLGTAEVKQMRQFSGIPMDIHLMIEEPGDKIEWFAPQKGDYVSVHVETTRHIQRVLARIRSLGAKPMAALNPATPLSMIEEIFPDVDAILVMCVNPGYAGQKLVPQTLEKISRLRSLLDDKGFEKVEIEVDGNVTPENAVKMRKAGADIFVAGTSLIFKPGDMEEHILGFYKEMEKL